MGDVLNGGKFQIGHQRGGRPKGSQNKNVLEVRRFCQDIVSGAEYRTKLAEDLIARRVSPAIELMLWERAWGAIEKTVRIDDVQTLDTSELLRRMRTIAASMPEADVIGMADDSNEPGNESDPPA